jgi:hypothetical protein
VSWLHARRSASSSDSIPSTLRERLAAVCDIVLLQGEARLLRFHSGFIRHKLQSIVFR